MAASAVERFRESRPRKRHVARELAGRIARREAQLPAPRARASLAASGRSGTSRAAVRAAISASRASSVSCPAVTCSPKNSVAVSGSWCASSRMTVLQFGQELRHAFVAQHDVGEEQVVIDDDDVRVERFLARLHHEAVGVMRAVLPEAVVARAT